MSNDDPNLKIILYDKDENHVITEFTCSGLVVAYKSNDPMENPTNETISLGTINMELSDMVKSVKAISAILEDLISDMVDKLPPQAAKKMINEISKLLNSHPDIAAKGRKN